MVRIPRFHRGGHVSHPSRHLSIRHLKKAPIGLKFILILHYHLISSHTKSQVCSAFHSGGGGEGAMWRLGRLRPSRHLQFVCIRRRQLDILYTVLTYTCIWCIQRNYKVKYCERWKLQKNFTFVANLHKLICICKLGAYANELMNIHNYNNVKLIVKQFWTCSRLYFYKLRRDLFKTT